MGPRRRLLHLVTLVQQAASNATVRGPTWAAGVLSPDISFGCRAFSTIGPCSLPAAISTNSPPAITRQKGRSSRGPPPTPRRKREPLPPNKRNREHLSSDKLDKEHPPSDQHRDEVPVKERPPQHDMEHKKPMICHVRAYYRGHKIFLPTVKRLLGKSVTAVATNRDMVMVRENAPTGPSRGSGEEPNTYAVYRYGVLVVFSSSPSSQSEDTDMLRNLGWHTEVQEGADEPPIQEQMTLIIRPDLPTWYKKEPDQVVLQQLDQGNLEVISGVLAQYLALEAQHREVDQIMIRFHDILAEIATTGRDRKVSALELSKLIGRCGLINNKNMSEYRLLDPADVAWGKDKYYDLWESVRRDFMLERRFKALNEKMGPLLENAKYILEVMRDNRSHKEERTIIYLIAVEIALSLLGMRNDILDWIKCLLP